MKVKKNLSLEDTILREAESRAKELNLNFAAYIVTLINKDLGKSDKDKYIRLVDDKKDMYRGMSRDVLDAADSIMNMG